MGLLEGFRFLVYFFFLMKLQVFYYSGSFDMHIENYIKKRMAVLLHLNS